MKINKGQRIFMDNNATEYLLYLMKKSAMEKGRNMDELDIQKFLDFYGAKEKKIKQNIMIGIRVRGPD